MQVIKEVENLIRSCNSLVRGALMVNLLLIELEYDAFKLQNSTVCRILTTNKQFSIFRGLHA